MTKIAHYCGLPKKLILEYNLNIPRNLFQKALLRDKGYTIGRLDSRYKGIDRQTGGFAADYPAEAAAWAIATPAINIYLRNDLNYKTDLKYIMFGYIPDGTMTMTIPVKTCGRLLPKIHTCMYLLNQKYFDGSCDYFDVRYYLGSLIQAAD